MTIPPPEEVTNAPQELDAAMAAGLQSHRENLVRAARNQLIRTRVALGLSATIALFALAAYLIGDKAAAKFCGALACVSFAFNCLAGMAGRRKALEALRQMDQR